MDALSDVLRRFRLSGGLFFRVELRAPFGVCATEQEDLRTSFGQGADHVLPFHMVTQGAMWFEVPGQAPARLSAGDIIVIPQGLAHSLLDEPGRPAVPVSRLQHQVGGSPPTLRHGGDGEIASALCGFFRCQGKLFNPLLSALPPTIVLGHEIEQAAWIGAALQRAFVEDHQRRPGTEALIERLIDLLFLEVVQFWLSHHEAPGWMAGLRDPLVSSALTALHAEPSRPWTVGTLARRVGASRTVLAERFRATTGQPIMGYLTQWRMELAAGLLTSTDLSVAEIATQVGYHSEASLNRAFKRHVGAPPATWRRSRTPEPPIRGPASGD